MTKGNNKIEANYRDRQGTTPFYVNGINPSFYVSCNSIILKRHRIMKKVFAIGLFLFICAQLQAQIIINSDGTHSVQHGMHAVNLDGTISAIHGNHLIHSNGTISVIHGSTIVNPNGTVGVQHGIALNDNVAMVNGFFNKKGSKESISNTKFQNKQQVLFRGRMINLSFHLDKADDQEKSKKEEKRKVKEDAKMLKKLKRKADKRGNKP